MAGDGDGDCGGDGGKSLKDGMSEDWVVVARDPEMLHGHKICRRPLTGTWLLWWSTPTPSCSP